MKHGGDLTQAKARFGQDNGPAWLDLSTGINPHAWPIPDELRLNGWTRLPSEGELQALVQAARAAYGVPGRLAVTAAPGTQALIQWLPRLAPAGEVAVIGPTYGEHAAAWRAVGVTVRDVDGLGTVPASARHIVLVHPNNPDGRIVPAPDIRAAAERCGAQGGWLVVDESFADVAPEASAVATVTSDLPAVILRSFGKFYGLAGLRLGFAIAPPAIAGRLESALGPWAVSGPAIAVGTAALRDTAWSTATRGRLARESLALDGLLVGAGLKIVGGTSLYRLARVEGAHALHEHLARHHVWVRRFDEASDLLRFGLPPDEASLERLRRVLHMASPGVGPGRGDIAE